MHLVSELSESIPYIYEIQITPLRKSRGRCLGWLVVIRDISERKQLELQLQSLAYYDALTGLPNRVLAHDRLEQALARGHRTQSCTGVVFLDLDHFKEINDALGHYVGDEMLRSVAQRLKTTVRESDTVARFGGDEFVLILPDIPDRNIFAQIVQRILEEFAVPFELRDRAFPISLSLGLTLACEDGDNVDLLLKQADIAMYQAKLAGGGRFAFYTPYHTQVQQL